jgi:molecular chaperone DnaK
MTTPPIGIDLGTSTSVLSAFIDGKPKPIRSALSERGSPIVPSLVAWRDGDEFLVGYSAGNERGRPGNFVQEVKREMGTDVRVPLGPHRMRPQEVSALLLRRLAETASAAVGGPITDAVISVPANFKDAARQATLDAAAIAGLKVPMLIAEPTAAALAYGVQHLDADERVMVFDFGGGTLDITLLQMCEGAIDVERVDGDQRLGGKDIDEAILGEIKRRFLASGGVLNSSADGEIKRQCELAKIALSSGDDAPIYVANAGTRSGKSLALDERLTRSQLDVLLSPMLDRAGELVRRLLVGDGTRFRRVDPKAVSRVLLVGGTTYIPAVRQRVAEIMGREVHAEVHPDLAVSMGACVRAAIHAGLESAGGALVLADVSPFAVGVEVVQPLRDGVVIPGVFSPLIERNQPIPHRSSHVYNLMHPQQEACNIKVFQGNGAFVEENEQVASAHIKDIPPSPTDEPRELHINFSFDLSGIVSLEVRVPNTSVVATLQADPRLGRMSDAEKAAAVARVAPKVEDSPHFATAKPLMDRAAKVLSSVGEANARRTAAALKKLNGALVAGNKQTIDEAEDELADALLDEGSAN